MGMLILILAMFFVAVNVTEAEAASAGEALASMAESQIGYESLNSKGTRATNVDPRGQRDYNKYGAFTGTNGNMWCAAFVSWCVNQSGVSTVIVPKSASTLVMSTKSNSYRSMNTSNFATMARGDVIFFSKVASLTYSNGGKAVHHVGIVTGVDRSANAVTMVEGNTSSDTVKRNTYYIDPSNGRITKGYSGTEYLCGYISVGGSLPDLSFRSYIDSPAESVSFAGNVDVQGWAIGSTSPTSVVYSINGGAEKPLTLFYRSDVSEKHPAYPKANNGWRGTIPNAEFKRGSNTITFTAIFAGSDRHVIGSRTVKNTWTGTAPTITDVKVTNVTVDGYTVTCSVDAPGEISRVSFPTWTKLNGQDDITWEYKEPGGKSATIGYNVKVSAHGGFHGLYSTHIYVHDKLGYVTDNKIPSNVLVPTAMTSTDKSDYLLVDTAALRLGWLDAQNVVSNSYQGIYGGGYLAAITSEDENATVATLAKGRNGYRDGYWIGLNSIDSDEFAWTSGEVFDYSNWGSGQPAVTSNKHYGAMMWSSGLWENLTNSAASSGYIQDGYSNMGFIVEVPKVSSEPVLSEPSIDYDSDGSGFTVKVRIAANANVSRVQFPTWTAASQSDIRWSEGKIANGYATYHVNKADYGHKGPYYIHAYARDAADNVLDAINVAPGSTVMLPVAKATWNGHTYYAVDKMADFETAQRWASAFRGEVETDGQIAHLVTIESAEEQQAVAALAGKADYPLLWLGLSDSDNEGSFEWVTGQKLGYANWTFGEPGGGTAENHVVISRESGQWRDVVNSNKFGDSPIGYIVEFEPLVAEKPVAAEGLVYNGQIQAGLSVSGGYSLVGCMAAEEVGEYTVTAVLDEGYTWSDGTTEDVVLDWSIDKASGNTVTLGDMTFTYDGALHQAEAASASAEGSTILYSFDRENWSEELPSFDDVGTWDVYAKAVHPNYADSDVAHAVVVIQPAKLTASYRDETVEEGETPKCSIELSGFVADEDEDSAFDFEMPTLTLPSDLTVGEYQLIPVGGSALNYEFEYIPGTLTVKAHEHTTGEPTVENEVPASCEKEGSYDSVVKCVVCGEELSRKTVAVPAAGHDWGTWETVSGAMCGMPGVEKRVCKSDESHVEQRTTKALGHSYVATVIEPAADSDGYTVHVCSRCGDAYIDNRVESLDKQANRAAAQEVQAVLDELPAPGELTLADAGAVADARAAYEALTDAQKALVEGADAIAAAEKRLADLADEQRAAEDQAAADAAIAAIKAIPPVSGLSKDDAEGIAAAKAAIATAHRAYDGLTAGQLDLVTNANYLFAAEQVVAGLEEQAAGDVLAADEVDGLIARISTKGLDASDAEGIAAARAAVDAARAAYDGLTADQKALVQNAETLFASEVVVAGLEQKAQQAADAQEAEGAVAAIAQIPALDSLTGSDDDKAKVAAARAAYEALTADQKRLVEGYDALVAAEQRLVEIAREDAGRAEEQAAVAPVANAIAQLPAADAVAPGDVSAVAAARAAYDMLSEEQRASVDEAPLVQAEAALVAAQRDAFEKAVAGASIVGADEVEVGKSAVLAVSGRAASIGAWTWATSDGDVAAVEEFGTVTGVAEGTATITASCVYRLYGGEELAASLSKGVSVVLQPVPAKPRPIDGAAVSGIVAKTYTGKAITQAPVVKLDGKALAQGADYTVSYENNVKAGTATVTIEGTGAYAGSVSKTFAIAKAKNGLKAKGSTKKVSAKKLKKAKRAVKAAVKVTGAVGEVTYRKASGKAAFKVAKKTGKITVKKDTKKGTYKLKVTVTAKGDANHKVAKKIVTVKIRVK